jgi:putative sterol carrier protein
MSLPFPSAEWAEAYRHAINQNVAYKKSAAAWEQGAIALVALADAQAGLAEAHGMILDLKHGSCNGVIHTTDRARIDQTPFVIEASYANWKAVMRGELDPVRAMLGGQLKLTRGHLPTIIRDVEGARQLVLSASAIDTAFSG